MAAGRSRYSPDAPPRAARFLLYLAVIVSRVLPHTSRFPAANKTNLPLFPSCFMGFY